MKRARMCRRVTEMLLFVISFLFVRILMPNHVVGQANNAITGTLGHLGEALGFGLVLKGVAGEVDACYTS